MYGRTFALLAATTALAAPAAAQSVYEIEEIVVSANLEETEAERTGASVTVVTEEDLKATGETRLVEFLSRLPGVTIRTTGPIGGQAGLSIRGASQNYVAVLVDGIDVTDPSRTQVAFDFGGLTTADVSRIEVLRGSQSALYGSRAVGGVINITTRRATEEGISQTFAAEAGSYNSARLSYGFARKAGATDYALTLSHAQTDGFSAADENAGNTEDDGYRADRVSLTVNHALENGAVLSFSGFVEDSEGDYDEVDFLTGLPFDGTPDETTDALAVGLRGAVAFSTGAIDHTVAATFYRIDRQYATVTAFGPANYAYTGTRHKLAWQGATDLGSNTRLVFGADVTHERYEQRGDYGSADRSSTIAGVVAEVSHAFTSDLDVTATLRHDDHSRFGGFTTGRLSAAYRPTDDLILRAVAATGFRAPSNYELYGDFVGNPDLEAEQSRSFELGAEYLLPGGGSIRATAFWLEAENLIDYSFATFSYDQISGTSRRSGLELAGEVPLGERAVLTGSYTYTDSATSASSWALVPRHEIALGVEAQLADRLRGAFTVEHAADRDSLPDYTVANATFTYDLGQETEAYLRVENLFDEEYQLVPGYGTSDRAFYAGLRKSF
ncbi:TonB-dependent receptor plug domain-containing protein [Ostreiculturibacter nitratireducens]|uniref:TonB-dependent receptor plug domain-containing protein n=1 Tax=Ostreiculturibacter nitratireducens TaxID=3075226 RepID=UPI0031B5A82D